MKWYNVSVDHLPVEGQEVLISFEGVYYIATYDPVSGVFYPKNSPRVSINAKNNLIYWSDINRSEQSPE